MGSDLALDEHGHVHEHVVQFLDGLLQLHDVIVTRLDVLERLLGLLRVCDDLNNSGTEGQTFTQKLRQI